MAEQTEEININKNYRFKYIYVISCIAFLLIGTAVGMFLAKSYKLGSENNILKNTTYETTNTTDINNAQKDEIKQEDLKKEIILNCKNEAEAIFSEDKRYKACLIDGEYTLGRIMDYSDHNYYSFEPKFGSVKYGSKEYIAYPDYYFRYIEAGVTGGNFNQIYSRIIELDTENKQIKVVADPFMLPDAREWQSNYGTPQFMIFSDKSYHISPNGRYLIAAVADCTQCSAAPVSYAIDLTTEKVTKIGLFFDGDDSPTKWLDNNSLEWYELSVEESADGEGLGGFEYKNIGKRITTL